MVDAASGEIGQVGTQFDGLGNVGCRVAGEDTFYNGFKLSEFERRKGMQKRCGKGQVGGHHAMQLAVNEQPNGVSNLLTNFRIKRADMCL